MQYYYSILIVMRLKYQTQLAVTEIIDFNSKNYMGLHYITVILNEQFNIFT